MKKTILIISSIVMVACLRAQPVVTPEMKLKDSIIKVDIIDPAVSDANDNAEEPQWDDLAKTITASYDATYADRTVTKAKIYYYYGKDWQIFASMIVHYTVAYEDKEDTKLMNKNARFVWQASNDKAELETALGWVKHALEKEPGNAGYQQTVDDLINKIGEIK